MDKTILVEKDLLAGKTLIDALDRSGFDVQSALWLLEQPQDVWRLYIASEVVHKQGLLTAYSRLLQVLRTLDIADVLSLDDISIVSPKDDVIQTFKGLHIRSLSAPLQLSSSSINNVFVGNAYLYRALP